MLVVGVSAPSATMDVMKGVFHSNAFDGTAGRGAVRYRDTSRRSTMRTEILGPAGETLAMSGQLFCRHRGATASGLQCCSVNVDRVIQSDSGMPYTCTVDGGLSRTRRISSVPRDPDQRKAYLRTVCGHNSRRRFPCLFDAALPVGESVQVDVMGDVCLQIRSTKAIASAAYLLDRKRSREVARPSLTDQVSSGQASRVIFGGVADPLPCRGEKHQAMAESEGVR
ncbi:hypothetical protein QBC44DRAFT_396420 [Cladorrhinum sp. PSN332]|nr:hypothetical protein QBC44DRAFT_396420 [Cladorrhinum sp. PSN332]